MVEAVCTLTPRVLRAQPVRGLTARQGRHLEAIRCQAGMSPVAELRRRHAVDPQLAKLREQDGTLILVSRRNLSSVFWLHCPPAPRLNSRPRIWFHY